MPPTGTISVGPDELVDAGREVGAAVTDLAAATDVLDTENGTLQDGSVLEQDGEADHKISRHLQSVHDVVDDRAVCEASS